MNEKLENRYFSDKYQKSLVLFVFLLFKLYLRKLRHHGGKKIYVPHILDGTLQQPRAKTNTPPKCDERQETKFSTEKIKEG